jgi:hypothetical protein
LIHSMRLSLVKGAHADLSSTAWQEIGVKPAFGLSGMSEPQTVLAKSIGPMAFSRAGAWIRQISMSLQKVMVKVRVSHSSQRTA